MKKLKKISRDKILTGNSDNAKRFNNIQSIINANTESEVSPYLGGGLGYFGTDADQLDRAGSPRNPNLNEVDTSEYSNDDSFLEEAWGGIKSAPKFAADTYRQLLKRVYESWQGEDEQQLLHINDQQKDLDLIKGYKDTVGTYSKVKDQLDYLKNYFVLMF